MSARTTWSPGRSAPVALHVRPPGSLAALLRTVRSVEARLGVPVQALRADRVLSDTHLGMAHVHAQRARAAGRGRADDPAVEFLLYAACSRQIHVALDVLGLPPSDEAPILLVALASSATRDAAITLAEAAAAAGLAAVPPPAPGPALHYWHNRLLPDAPLDHDGVERALLAAMAALAVAKT